MGKMKKPYDLGVANFCPLTSLVLALTSVFCLGSLDGCTSLSFFPDVCSFFGLTWYTMSLRIELDGVDWTAAAIVILLLVLDPIYMGVAFSHPSVSIVWYWMLDMVTFVNFVYSPSVEFPSTAFVASLANFLEESFACGFAALHTLYIALFGDFGIIR